MKKLTALLLGSMLLPIIFFSSCFKDHCTQTYSYFMPLYKTTQEVRANVKSNPPEDIQLPGKIYIRGNYIFLNELDKGIHIIDNSNPAAPRNAAFINIPGNMDLAVKGNTLYADAYTDLVALDISDPLHVKPTKFISGVFPFRQYYGIFYPDSSKVIVDWVKRDTVVSMDCGDGGFFGMNFDKHNVLMSSDLIYGAAYTNRGNLSLSVPASASSPFGVGGSMARFAILNDYLYSVTTSDLNVFGISAPRDPEFSNLVNVGMNIETIYPFKNKLFIGSSNGMYIFDASNGKNPSSEGQFAHTRSCDPVIADGKYAYVTLRSGNQCMGFTNQLEILDISDLKNPSLIGTYPLTNPRGLSKDGNLLFICDGSDGLKIFDATDVNHLQLINTIPGMETFDVIAWNHIALVVANGGIYQYDYSDPNNIRLMSKIEVKQ